VTGDDRLQRMLLGRHLFNLLDLANRAVSAYQEIAGTLPPTGRLTGRPAGRPIAGSARKGT
jgi:hypothetical protein